MAQALLVFALALTVDLPAASPYFTIEVVDEQTGRGVPLVELKTVNEIRLVTDSQGLVAFNEPGLMNQSVFFHVKSHGYEFPKDGFGSRGKALKVQAGGSAQLKVKRINIAERLYRVTGEGIYRDSVLLGRPVPLSHPVLSGKVLGSDSVVNTVYQGKIRWFWGDTNQPAYPLGNFNVPGATSLLAEQGGLDPSKGVNLEYLVGENGFARATAPVPGPGPTWIDGLVAFTDPSGRERMFAWYVKIRNLLEAYERGLVEFDDASQTFKKVTTIPLNHPVIPGGHPFLKTVDGVPYIYFAKPYPLIRVKADPKALADPAQYEAYTCLVEGARRDAPRIDRDAQGRARYRWKPNTPPLFAADQAKLVASGTLKTNEGLLALRDVETGKEVVAHGGSVYWNEHRERWVLITVEAGGTSYLGEVWFAEAGSPLGPWVHARKVVTHDKYSFYNPKQHPMFDQDGGKTIYFEGTYTHTFSGNDQATARYDYNQVMYRLDLDDPRLNLPRPVFRQNDGFTLEDPRVGSGLPKGENVVTPFYALPRAGEGTSPVYEVKAAGQERHLTLTKPEGGGSATPLFHLLPADAPTAPAASVPLYEFVNAKTKTRRYSTETSLDEPDFTRSETPLGQVWNNPTLQLPPRE